MKTIFTKKRIIFLGICLGLVAAEFVIGAFVHDRILRPYGGDVIIAVVVYAFVRVFIPEKPILLALYVFLFCALVEASQLIPLVDLLGIQNRFLRIAMGTSFAWGDMLAYAIGCLAVLPYDMMLKRRAKS